MTGTGFDQAHSGISILFIPENGDPEITVPVSNATTTSVQAMVPAMFDPNTGASVAETVDVQVVQVTGSIVSTSTLITGLSISALPAVASTVPKGAMTLELMQSAATLSATAETNAGSGTALQLALNQYGQDLATLESAVTTIINDPTQTVAIPLANGSTTTLDANTLAISDQIAQALIAAIVNQGQIPIVAASSKLHPMSVGTHSPRAVTTCVSNPSGDTLFDSNICSIQTIMQNLSGANPAVNQAANKVLANLTLGMIGEVGLSAAFGPEVPLAYSLIWGGSSAYISSWAVTGQSPDGTDVAGNLGTSYLDTLAKDSHTGTVLGTVKDMFDVLKLIATTAPPTKGIVPSSAMIVPNPGGGSALVFPDGTTLVQLPTSSGSFDSTTLVLPPGQTVQLIVSTASQSGGTGSVSSFPSGIGCGSTCNASFPVGSTVSLTATPDSGSTFQGWGGACSGTGSCAVTMNSSQSVTATFTKSSTFTGQFSGSGSVTNVDPSSDGSYCNFTVDVSGQMTIDLASQSGGQVSGTGSATGNYSNFVNSGFCVDGSGGIDATGTLSGSTSSLSWSGGDFPLVSFTGQVDGTGTTVTGTATFTYSLTTGSIVVNVTLTKQ
ncbi:MAG TPA: hypothetical protein VFW94_06035 [Candidatus Acidoferrales bacterium]|nr:hypothetical protein [Candidatus Acidoferrales bacterium]